MADMENAEGGTEGKAPVIEGSGAKKHGFGSSILVVTGRFAESQVMASLARSRRKADLMVLDLDVAAFITPEMLTRSVPNRYDLILIPGAITADFHEAEAKLGSKIRLGPKHAVDLWSVLDQIDEVELSTTVPACTLLSETMQRDAKTRLRSLEEEASASLMIRGVKIGGSSRMKVLAEIVDATRLSQEDLRSHMIYVTEQGADMIDLGVPLDACPEDVRKTVLAARKATDLPLSIDTLDPVLLLAGAEAGADLVLSLNGDILPLVGPRLAELDTAAVIIPGPDSSLAENLDNATAMGLRIIADPVLSPPLQGMTRSLVRYLELASTHPQIPLFFGSGNVTELIDADSQGVNALLAASASEVGASVLFTPEYSPKARGSVRELRRAAEMMALARERESPPKDLGLDLLVVKEKRRRADGLIPEGMEVMVCEPHGRPKHLEMDPRGPFMISLARGKILIKHDELVAVGSSAQDLMNLILERGLVSRLDHAAYLGRELARAEMALALGRSYAQDDEF